MVFIKSMEFLGFTLDLIGKVLVAYTAIRVHYRFWKEHRIDAEVFKVMKREQLVGFIGIVLIVLGYLLQIPSKLG